MNPLYRSQTNPTSDEAAPAWLSLVREQVASLRFGTVLITIHDSRVVQVEKNEKVRLDQPPSTSVQRGERS